MQAAVAAGIKTVAIPNWVTLSMPRPAGVMVTLTTLAELPFETLLATF
jgi:beta-phosphoglucomutase-like phosphatase (HAD superfamily)